MITNRFNRTDFYKKIIVDGIEQLDFTSNSFDNFKFTREMTYYKVTDDDIARPDLIAVKAYNNRDMINVWWIIMAINLIQDCFNDIYIGQILNIPHKNDLEDLLNFNSNK